MACFSAFRSFFRSSRCRFWYDCGLEANQIASSDDFDVDGLGAFATWGDVELDGVTIVE